MDRYIDTMNDALAWSQDWSRKTQVRSDAAAVGSGKKGHGMGYPTTVHDINPA